MLEGYELVRKLIDINMYEEIKLDYDPFKGTLIVYYDLIEENKSINEKRKKYCNKCNNIETFSLNQFPSLRYNKEYKLKIKEDHYNDSIMITEKCSNCDIDYIYYFKIINEGHLMKVGEYPSSYQKIQIDNKYSKFLPNKKIELLNKAVFLNSHSYHKAGMVYLRTCYEYLIDYLMEKDNIEMKDNMKMKDKVISVKKYFPKEFQVSKIYEILSEDVHSYINIDEEEMNKRFNIIYNIMKHIYDDLIRQNLEEKERKENAKLLQQI